MRPTITPLLAAATATLALAACTPLPSASSAAVVGDEAIPRARVEAAVTGLDLDTLQESIEAGLPADLEGADRAAAVDTEVEAVLLDTQRRTLDVLIRFELIERMAADAGAEASEEDRAESRELLLASVGGEEGLEAALQQSRLTEELFDEVIVPQEALVLALRRELAAGEQLDVRTPRHILVTSEEEAEEILAELDAGAEFAALAEERSQDPGSAAEGGDLPAQPRGGWLPEFDQAVWEAEVGEVVGPVQTEAGFHIIEVVSADTLGPDELSDQQIQQLTGPALEERFLAVLDDTEVVVDPAFGVWDVEAPGGPAVRAADQVGTGAPRPAGDLEPAEGEEELSQEELEELLEELEEGS
ncbi:MAG: peptidylprolyl isomerase [Nitriliruptoraceae bacterium]